MGGKNNNSTDAADAAATQGETDRKLALDKTYADRPDQTNPFGSVKWESQLIDPATGQPTEVQAYQNDPSKSDKANNLARKAHNDSMDAYTRKWSQKQTYSDQTQGLIDQQMGNMEQRGMMQNNAMKHASEAMQDAPDWAQFGEAQGLEYDSGEIRQRAEDAAYQRDTMRLDPQMAEKRAAMETKMRQQGLRAGDRAWDSQMDTFNQGSNDAYERARLGSVGQGRLEASDEWGRQMQGTEHANALRDKKIAEHLDKRNFSLDEANRIGAGKKDVLDFVGGAG